MVKVVPSMAPPAPARAPSAGWWPPRCGWHLLDSGALYRLVALAGEQQALAGSDKTGHARIARQLDATSGRCRGRGAHRAWPARDVTAGVRYGARRAGGLPCGGLATGAAGAAGAPARFARPPGLVADGRDMGTVVFPSAILKVFLSASRGGEGQEAL